MKTAQKAGENAKNDKQKQREGFDNPLASPEMDLLGRRSLTQQVYSHLTNLEPEWSVRVGLLAPWGEGKSTVCDWIIEKAKEEGHIAVTYKPWAAKNDSELWHNFYSELVKALPKNSQNQKPPALPSNFKNIRSLSEWGRSWALWGFRKIKYPLSKIFINEKLDKLSEAHQISQAGLGTIQSIFSMTDVDVKNLRALLPEGKRFIVVVDDLDRVDAKLIPRFLLSLRDVMDINSFSFLLPFDEEIIAHALAQYGNTKEYGENFLEKILDYRVHMKAAPEENILALFKSEMDKYCPFVHVRLLDSIAKLLPRNPRKLKGLVRSLRAYENEAKRHRDGEIDWRALLFGQMIRIESESFFQAYIKDTFFRKGEINMFDTSGASPWLIAAMNDKDGEGDNLEQKRIQGILDKVTIAGDEKRVRITSLCEEMRKSYGFTGHHTVLYALKLVENPEILTWGEFDAVWDSWVKKPKLATLLPWIEEHSKNLGISKADVVKELLTTLSQRYGEILEKASAVALASEHELAIKQANDVLVLVDTIFSEGFDGILIEEILTTETFQKLLNVVLTWVHFDGNQADKNHRVVEKEFLKKWVDKANKSGRAAEFGQMFNKMAIDVDRFNDKKDKLSAKLCDDLKGQSDITLLDAAVSVLSEPGGIRKLMPYDAGIGIKGILLNPSSVLWNPSASSQGMAILAKAVQNTDIQKNALDFLDLIRKCANEGAYEMRMADANKIFQSPELIVAVWNAAIATPLQFRRLHETREIRTYLINKGVEERLLAAPDWLMANVEVDKKKKAA